MVTIPYAILESKILKGLNSNINSQTLIDLPLFHRSKIKQP